MAGSVIAGVHTSSELFRLLFSASSQTFAALVELTLGSIAFVTAVLAARVALRGLGASRAAWWVLTAALVAWGTSNALFDLTVLAPVAGSAEVARDLQLVAIGMIVVSMAVMPAGRWQPGVRLRTSVDIVVMLLCVALVGTVVVVRFVLAHASSPGDELFSLLYPCAALLLCSQAYAKARRVGDRSRPELPAFVAGFAAWAFAGVGYALTTPSGVIGAPAINLAFGCGTALITYGAWAAGRPVRSSPGPHLRSYRVLLALPEIVVVA